MKIRPFLSAVFENISIVSACPGLCAGAPAALRTAGRERLTPVPPQDGAGAQAPVPAEIRPEIFCWNQASKEKRSCPTADLFPARRKRPFAGNDIPGRACRPGSQQKGWRERQRRNALDASRYPHEQDRTRGSSHNKSTGRETPTVPILAVPVPQARQATLTDSIAGDISCSLHPCLHPKSFLKKVVRLNC